MKSRTPMRLAYFTLVALVLLFLIVPVIIVVPMSFSDSRFLSFPPRAYSVRWYEAFFGNPAWLDAARTSLTVAALATLIATPLGVLASYAINASGARVARYARAVLLLPLMVPVIIIAIGVFFVYARLGLVTTLPGLVLANIMLGLPYVVVSVTAGLADFDPAQEMVARSLGMNRLRAFMTVTLPQVRASVLSGALFVFISVIDETIVALFISGGEYQTLTKRMFTALRDEIDPTIAAISTMLTGASFILAMIVMSMRRRR